MLRSLLCLLSDKVSGGWEKVNFKKKNHSGPVCSEPELEASNVERIETNASERVHLLDQTVDFATRLLLRF